MSDIEMKIAYENQKYWQSRFLFGNEYHEFIYDLALNWNTQCQIPKTYLTKNDDFHLVGEVMPEEYKDDQTIPLPLDVPLPLLEQHSPEELKAVEHAVFKLATGFYIGVLQRASNKAPLPSMINLLKAYINKTPTNALWFLEEFCNELIIEENLLHCSPKEMRKFMVGLLYCAMLKVYALEKDKLNLYWKQPTNPAGFTVLGNFVLILIKNLYELRKFN